MDSARNLIILQTIHQWPNNNISIRYIFPLVIDVKWLWLIMMIFPNTRVPICQTFPSWNLGIDTRSIGKPLYCHICQQRRINHQRFVKLQEPHKACIKRRDDYQLYLHEVNSPFWWPAEFHHFQRSVHTVVLLHHPLELLCVAITLQRKYSTEQMSHCNLESRMSRESN